MQDDREGLRPSKKDTQLIQPMGKFLYTGSDGETTKQAIFAAYERVDGKLCARYMLEGSNQQVTVVSRPLEKLVKQNPRDEKGEEMFFSMKVMRSSGEVDDGWRFGEILPVESGQKESKVHLTKLEITGAGTPTGMVFTKDVSMSDLIALNVESKGKN